MSTGAFVAADAYTIGNNPGVEIGTFVPEVWSMEIIAAYKSNLVLEQLVTVMTHPKQKGDTIRIPQPVRSQANRRRTGGVLQNFEVQPIVDDAGEVVITVGEHYEYSALYEDFLQWQALPSHRRFVTDDAGFALASQVDTDLHLLGADNLTAQYGPGDIVTATDFVTATPGVFPGGQIVVGSDGLTPYDGANAASLTDAGIRRSIRLLDDENVPMRERAWVIPPVEKENLLGISRFTEEAFTGEKMMGNSIRNGLVGDLYAHPVYVSTNCPTLSGGGDRVAKLIHKDAFVLAMQNSMRTQASYQQTYLSTLFTADIAYGLETVRPENVVNVVVPG